MLSHSPLLSFCQVAFPGLPGEERVGDQGAKATAEAPNHPGGEAAAPQLMVVGAQKRKTEQDQSTARAHWAGRTGAHMSLRKTRGLEALTAPVLGTTRKMAIIIVGASLLKIEIDGQAR